ncbi:MAG: hypothetical protein NUV75_05490 [Gallionella sp.]|nr:hypothetical protein [Gallionella sp.]
MAGQPLTRRSRQILAEMDAEWWDGVFDRVASGGRLAGIAEEYCVVPGVLGTWVEAHYRERYERALEVHGELRAQEIIPIADGVVPVKLPDGSEVYPDEKRDRLRITARVNAAKAWHPERYGRSDNSVPGSMVIVFDADLLALAARLSGQRPREIDVTPELTVLAQIGCAPAQDSIADDPVSIRSPESAAPWDGEI